MDDNFQIDFLPLEISSAKASLGLPDNEVEDYIEDEELELSESAKNKLKGKLSRSARYSKPTVVSDTPLPPAPLGKRDEREVKVRIQNIMLGATGILGNAKEYLAMTDDEAEAIAEPLASYLVRNADTIPVARQVLENYDLAAITIGVGAYVVRVYHDRVIESSENRSSKISPIDRIRSFDEESESEQEVWPNSGFRSSISQSGGTSSGL